MSEDLQIFDEATTFARTNDDGLIEIVDEMTGQILAIQESYKDLFTNSRDQLIKHEMPDGKTIYIEKGVSLDRIKNTSQHIYSTTLASIICQKVTEGMSLTKLCKEPGMPPYYVLAKWRAKISEFKDMLKQARLDRADMFRDKVIDAAEEDVKKDEAHMQKAKIDAYKWSAEKDNAEVYGNKTKVVGDSNAPLRLIVETGVPIIEQKTDEKDVTPQLTTEQDTTKGITTEELDGSREKSTIHTSGPTAVTGISRGSTKSDTD